MSHGQLLLALRRGQLQSGLWWWTIWSYTTTSIIVLALSLMLFDLLLTTIFATIYVALLHTHQIRIYTRTLIKQEWKCWGAMGFYLNSVQRIHECLYRMHAGIRYNKMNMQIAWSAVILTFSHVLIRLHYIFQIGNPNKEIFFMISWECEDCSWSGKICILVDT